MQGAFSATQANYSWTTDLDWQTGTFTNVTNSSGDLRLNWTRAYDGWLYRKPISISGSGSLLTDFQVNVTIVNATGKMNANYTDIRFTDSAGTPLPYWCENCTRTGNATFWVRVPSIPTTGTTIYAYYGNPQATDAQNATGTFEFFDDFSDGDYTNNPTWTKADGTWDATGGYLTNTGEDAWRSVYTSSAQAYGTWEMSLRQTAFSSTPNRADRQWFFINSVSGFSGNGYMIDVPLHAAGANRFTFYRIDSGSGVLIGSYEASLPINCSS